LENISTDVLESCGGFCAEVCGFRGAIRF